MGRSERDPGYRPSGPLPVDDKGVLLDAHINVGGRCGWCRTEFPCERLTRALKAQQHHPQTDRPPDPQPTP